EFWLNVISKLETVNSVIDIKLLSDSLPIIIELAKNKPWCVRQAITNISLFSQHNSISLSLMNSSGTCACPGWVTQSSVYVNLHP
ncbi:uncharacterized protein BJ212DRAFT_1555826, partial [Suillus subaureus]